MRESDWTIVIVVWGELFLLLGLLAALMSRAI